MSDGFFQPSDDEDRLKMTQENADCRGEVALFLLGLKPCVLFAYGTWPEFARLFARNVLDVWLPARAGNVLLQVSSGSVFC